MKHFYADTIAAIATPLGEGGIGVVRVSGPWARRIAATAFLPINKAKITARKMLHGWIVDPKTKAKIDQANLCFYRAPHSYTGEDVIEFFCHGSAAVLQKVLRLAIRSGARLAGRGEFTKRAFVNGKLDLAQAEAVIDLVQSKTEEGAGLALKQLAGRLSGAVKKIKASVMKTLVAIEAAIDFGEEIKTDQKTLATNLMVAQKEIVKLLADEKNCRIYRSGISAILAGPPNVGKSSLLNALLKEERAIVTNLPGTTRDAIEETLNIGGVLVRLIDTAGLREAKTRIEIIGIRRAKKEIAAGEILVVVVDARVGITAEEKKLMGENFSKKKIIVFNKIDLCRSRRFNRGRREKVRTIFVSALTGEGIDKLLNAIYNLAVNAKPKMSGSAIYVNERHRQALLGAQAALAKSLNAIKSGIELECVALEIKQGIMHLEEITGEQVSEEAINQIFDRFCVGK